jgi:hypothetical protein
VKTPSWRAVAAAAIVVAGLCFVVGLYSFGLTASSAAGRDFIEYWAAGQQLAHNANPYDIDALLRVEQAAGLDENEPKVTLSPPLILLLAYPLGFTGAKTGLILWLLLELSTLLASILLIWHLLGSPPGGFHWLGIAFPPALACLMAGQISTFLLFGVVLFLVWHRSRPFLAGAALVPCALKPHLFLAVAVALLLWIVSRKAYRLLAGFAVALTAGCALTLVIDPQSWSQYAQVSRSNHIAHLFVPTLSSYIRFLIDDNAVWLQFLPAAASCLWAVWYFRTRAERWDWMDQGLLVFLVAALCAPYGFFFDETVLLPAVIAGLFRADHAKRSLLPLAFIALPALAETWMTVPIVSHSYLWTTPAWLAWYLFASRKKPAADPDPRPLAPLTR